MVYRWCEMNEQNRQARENRQRLAPFPLSLALSHEGRGDASQSGYLIILQVAFHWRSKEKYLAQRGRNKSYGVSLV